MERTLSIEEKIKKAEEIYNKRNSQNSQYGIFETKNKKEYKFFNKIIIQLIICLSIYLVAYVIVNNQYVFSGDFKNNLREIMKNDIEIQKINEFINTQIKNIKLNNNNNGTVENNTTENTNNTESTSSVENSAKENSVTNEEAQEADISQIKEKISFIVPVVGVVTSRFGIRTPTTPTVPVNHTGIDIAAPKGTDILSATNGKVILNSDQGDYREAYKSIDRRYRDNICTL